jgi:hypothetical protein
LKSEDVDGLDGKLVFGKEESNGNVAELLETQELRNGDKYVTISTPSHYFRSYVASNKMKIQSKFVPALN